jgi:hypothetical protein
MSVALPIVFIGWARQVHLFFHLWSGLLTLVLFLLLEGLTVFGAVRAYVNYINRAGTIMKGG